MNWLIRMSMWARRPPPMWRVKLVIGVIAACFVIYLIEYFWGWPDILTLEKRPRYSAP